jgi:predicted nuclease with TOPRIM domain
MLLTTTCIPAMTESDFNNGLKKLQDINYDLSKASCESLKDLKTILARFEAVKYDSVGSCADYIVFSPVKPTPAYVKHVICLNKKAIEYRKKIDKYEEEIVILKNELISNANETKRLVNKNDELRKQLNNHETSRSTSPVLKLKTSQTTIPAQSPIVNKARTSQSVPVQSPRVKETKKSESFSYFVLIAKISMVANLIFIILFIIGKKSKGKIIFNYENLKKVNERLNNRINILKIANKEKDRSICEDTEKIQKKTRKKDEKIEELTSNNTLLQEKIDELTLENALLQNTVDKNKEIVENTNGSITEIPEKESQKYPDKTAYLPIKSKNPP